MHPLQAKKVRSPADYCKEAGSFEKMLSSGLIIEDSDSVD